MCLIFMGQGYPRKLFNLEHFQIYGISDFINFYHANHPCTCATIWLTALCCHGVATALKCLLNYVHLTYVVAIATGRAVA